MQISEEVVPKAVRLFIRLVLCKWVHPKTFPTGFSQTDPKVFKRLSNAPRGPHSRTALEVILAVNLTVTLVSNN